MPDPLIILPIRLAGDTIAEADRLAARLGLTRSSVLREAIARGLASMDERPRKAGAR